MTTQPAKNTVCLWYNDDAEEAARYAQTFPSHPLATSSARRETSRPESKATSWWSRSPSWAFPVSASMAGPAFTHNASFSFQVATADQAETDRYWHAIVTNGGEESACGWCKDKWGVSWQITPVALTRDHRPRPRCRQTRFRRDDADEEDRHRQDRGGKEGVSVVRTPKSDAAPWRRDRWERLLSRRGFTVATIHVARLGKIRVYVTHLGNSPDQQVQPAEVEQLIRFQQADAKKHKPQGTVIFGDFNAELASRALAPLWGAGFRVHSAGTAALRVEHGTRPAGFGSCRASSG